MVQFILLIVGIVYANRRPKLKHLCASTFPDVPGDDFTLWKKLEMASIDIFLWTTWGLFIVGTLAAIFLGLFAPRGAIGLQIILIVLFFLGQQSNTNEEKSGHLLATPKTQSGLSELR
jgi:hypothetical protein